MILRLEKQHENEASLLTTDRAGEVKLIHRGFAGTSVIFDEKDQLGNIKIEQGGTVTIVQSGFSGASVSAQTDFTGTVYYPETAINFRPDNSQISRYFIVEQTPNQAPASTSIKSIPEVVERTLVEIFASCANEEFEFGYNSNLESQLEDFIQRYGVDAVQAIRKQIPHRQFSVDLAIETLHTLGRSRHISSHTERFFLLISTLTSTSANIRSATALGLSYLDDIQAIPALEKALNSETQISVKSWMKRVLKQLKETQSQM